MERDEAKKQPVKPDLKDLKASAASSVSLHHSSLLSGTSQSGFDDLDYHRLFKKWDYDYSNLQIETPTAEEIKLGTCLVRETHLFKIRMGTLVGKEVCVKEFKEYEKEKEKNRALVQEYRKMKENLLGHPNLISPIGAIVDRSYAAIILELARNKEFRSLDDFLKSQQAKKDKPITKIGFPRKLFISKSVTLALSWIHGHIKRTPGASPISHGRLKPSNILFTSDWKVKVGDYGLTLPHALFSHDIIFKEQYIHYSAPELLVDPPPKAGTEQSDAWALGMIFYTLLTDKIPYDSCKNYDEVKKEILAKNLPDLPENTPGQLRSIIMKLWDHSPAARDVPAKIPTDVWPKILKEASLQGVKEGEKIWDEAVEKIGGDAKTNLIKWDVFGPILWRHLNVSTVQPTGGKEDKGKDTFQSKEKCVKYLLRVTPTDEVKLEHFAEFTKTFSPFRTGSDGPTTLADLVSLCKEKYFYGLKTRAEAEAILNGKQAKEVRKDKHSPFLLRLSDNMGYQFCFSYIEVSPTKEEAFHALISPESYETMGFYQHIKNEIKAKKLFAFDVNSDRPFDVFFDSKHKEYKLKTTPVGVGNTTMFNASISSTGTGKFIQ